MDHSGAEIFFDSLCRGGRHRFQKPRAELDAMRAIIVPLVARLDELAGGDPRGMTDDGDGFTLAARLHAQNAEAVVFVMKCYTLDEAGEDFRRWVIVCPHRLSDSLLSRAPWLV
jgi:hypothetical protein